MSLPNVSFINNLGTLQFERCLIGITDNWEYNGRVARHAKSITIDAHIKQGGINEGYQGLITDRTQDGKRYGSDGTLTLPWTVLNNIRIVDLEFQTGQWLNMIPVRVTFADDFPDINSYTISYFGLTIYNPRISLPVSVRALHDDYPQMRSTTGGFVFNDPLNGVFRNRAGQKNMELTITGAIRIDDNQLPQDLIARLIQRVNMAPAAPGVIFNLMPTGYPRVFNLGDAIPEVKNDLNLAHVFVIGAVLVWHVEEEIADINIQLMCPPQIVTRTQ